MTRQGPGGSRASARPSDGGKLGALRPRADTVKYKVTNGGALVGMGGGQAFWQQSHGGDFNCIVLDWLVEEQGAKETRSWAWEECSG